MSNQRYPEEFKIEAVKHITERGLRVADVAERLGVSRSRSRAETLPLPQTA